MKSKIFDMCFSWGLAVIATRSILMISTAVALAQAPREKETASKSKPPWQRVLQGDDAKRVEALENQIADLEKKGQFAEAVAPAREVLEIRRRVQGEDHWETINARVESEKVARMAGLARTDQSDLTAALRQDDEADKLYQEGRYAEAEALLRKVLAARCKVLGEDHPDTARSYSDLNTILNSLGKHTEAESLAQKELTICRKVLGEDHPDTARSYNNLAMSLDEQGKHAEAQPLLERALAIWCCTLGEDHPDTARGYNNVAFNLDGQGKYAQAEPLLQKALAIRRRTLGEDHPLTARSYNNLA